MTSVAGALITLGLAACALPVNVTEPGSPSLVGIVHRSDGTSAVGLRIGITNDYGDSACRHTNARAFSDSSGSFRFAPTTYVQHWVLLFPAFERWANYYAVCGGTADSVLDRAYEGSVSRYYHEAPARDTLRCLEWEWQNRARVICNGADADDRIQSGGSWSDAEGAGFFRLIVVRDRAKTPGGVYLQWVQRTSSGPPELVRETIALPLAPRPSSIDEAKLYATSTGTCVDLRSMGRAPHWYSLRPVSANNSLVLGAPGQTRAGMSCP